MLLDIQGDMEAMQNTKNQIEKLHNIEKENTELKAREKCPCLSDFSTCLAEDKWELAQREIKELKAQIEKMKCCGNCKYGSQHFYTPPCSKCGDKDKWELAE